MFFLKRIIRISQIILVGFYSTSRINEFHNFLSPNEFNFHAYFNSLFIIAKYNNDLKEIMKNADNKEVYKGFVANFIFIFINYILN